MKILAVSDKKSVFLENYITSSLKAGMEFDFIISCGDLSPRYLMMLADSTNQIIYYVNGNHNAEESYNCLHGQCAPFSGNALPGGIDLSIKPVIEKKYILCGFPGSMRYNNEPFQYSESEMKKKTSRMLRKIRMIRILEKLKKQTGRPLIVVSHAPPFNLGDGQDIPHRGFACFQSFIEKTKPLLWLHGHTHLSSFAEIRTESCGGTKIVNVYEFKTIEISPEGNIQINYVLGEK